MQLRLRVSYLVLLVEAGGTLVALELPLGMKVEVLHVLFLVEEAFPALPALVGFDTVNTDHVGSELIGGTGITDKLTGHMTGNTQRSHD